MPKLLELIVSSKNYFDFVELFCHVFFDERSLDHSKVSTLDAKDATVADGLARISSFGPLALLIFK